MKRFGQISVNMFLLLLLAFFVALLVIFWMKGAFMDGSIVNETNNIFGGGGW